VSIHIHPYSIACLIIASRQNLEKRRYAALEKWTEALESVHGAVVGKTGGSGRGGGGDPSMGMPSDPFGPLRDVDGRW
jgi:COP9 signalosome complex subunit 2